MAEPQGQEPCHVLRDGVSPWRDGSCPNLPGGHSSGRCQKIWRLEQEVSAAIGLSCVKRSGAPAQSLAPEAQLDVR